MDQQPPRRSSMAVALLAVLTIAGSAVGVMIYQLYHKEKPLPLAEQSSFDVGQVQENHPFPPSAASPMPQSSPQSGLGMLQTGDMGKMRFGDGSVRQTSAQKAVQTFTEAIRRAEGQTQSLAQAYTRRYPSIAQYGKDWMSYPDLKRLNDDYMRDHDPVRFLRGVAASKNFGKLMAKYATDPAVQSFVKEGIKQAPGDVTTSAMSLLKEDSLIKTGIATVASALGLPPALTAGILGGGKVDQNQVMGQIMQSNPDVKKAMQQ